MAKCMTAVADEHHWPMSTLASLQQILLVREGHGVGHALGEYRLYTSGSIVNMSTVFGVHFLLQIDNQEYDEDGVTKCIGTFQTPTLDEVLKRTHNNTALLKPFLVQCSDMLRSRDQNELTIFAVDADGHLVRYIEGNKLIGILMRVDKFVVRV